MIKYKLFNLKTNLYSHGGTKPIWSNRGKSWTSLKSLYKYLTKLELVPDNWVVVECQTVTTEIARFKPWTIR